MIKQVTILSLYIYTKHQAKIIFNMNNHNIIIVRTQINLKLFYIHFTLIYICGDCKLEKIINHM